MRGLIVLAVLGLLAFAATPAFAHCSEGHQTSDASTTTVTETATTPAPTKTGG